MLNVSRTPVMSTKNFQVVLWPYSPTIHGSHRMNTAHFKERFHNAVDSKIVRLPFTA